MERLIRRFPFALGLWILTTVLAFVPIFQLEWMNGCFERAAYFQVAAVVFLWAYAGYREFEAPLQRFVQSPKRGYVFLLVFILALFIFLTCPPYFKVLSDETNLIAVSRSMLFSKTTALFTQGEWLYDRYWPFDGQTPARPLLFPFLLHLIHAVTGYRPENAFVLNAISLSTLFYLSYRVVAAISGSRSWAWAGVLLLAAQTIVIQTATSAGFDLFAAMLALATFWALLRYLHNRTDSSFEWFWFLGVALSHARYESVLFFATPVIGLILVKKFPWELIKKSDSIALTPILLAPLLWQRLLIGDLTNAPFGGNPFSFERLRDHTATFFQTLFKFRWDQPGALILAFVAVFVLVCAVYRFRHHRVTLNPEVLSGLIFGIALLELFILVNAFYGGRLDYPTQARLYLPVFVGMTIFAAIGLSWVPSLKWRGKAGAVFAGLLFFYQYPSTLENHNYESVNMARQYRVLLDYFNRISDRNFLVIHPRPGLFAVREWGSFCTTTANLRRQALLDQLQSKRYQAIYAVQEIVIGSGKPTPESTLDPAFKLETVFEEQNTSGTFIRISKLLL